MTRVATIRFHAMDQTPWQEAQLQLQTALEQRELTQLLSPATLIIHDLLDNAIKAMHLSVFQRILESEAGLALEAGDQQLESLYRSELGEHGHQNLARACEAEGVYLGASFPPPEAADHRGPSVLIELDLPVPWDERFCQTGKLMGALGFLVQIESQGARSLVRLCRDMAGNGTPPAPSLISPETQATSLSHVFAHLKQGLIHFSPAGEVLAVSPTLLKRFQLDESPASIALLASAIPLGFHNDITWGLAIAEGDGHFENYRIRVALSHAGVTTRTLFNVSGFREADGTLVSLWQAVDQGDGEVRFSEGSILSEARVRNITRIYVPQLVEQKAREAVRLGKTSLTNEERRIAVLFCDIVGFTSYAETYADSESIIDTLNTILRRVSASVRKNSGYIDKFMGDCIMAFFDDPVAALLAAADMQSHSMDINSLRTRAGQQTLTLRVGIHWGQAIIGNVGTAERLDWTAIGDVVNTASRVEKACAPGSILISRELRDAVETIKPGHFRFGPVVGLQVKGKRDELAVCSVDSAVDQLP